MRPFDPGEFQAAASPPEAVPAAIPEPNPHQTVDALDGRLRASLARMTSGVSTWAALQAVEDWAFHLAASPMRMAALGLQAWTTTAALAGYAFAPPGARAEHPPFHPEEEDRRFRHPGWRAAPFDLLMQAQLAWEAQWRRATDQVTGARAQHLRRVRFMGAQILQAGAPCNFAVTNPEVVERIADTQGLSLMEGARLYASDLARIASGRSPFGPNPHTVGENLAITPGQIVFRNELMELIQYSPSTATVRPEPILIIPAWIMKYYILDLAPDSSVVKYLVDQGFTVFCISWRNPGAQDRDRSFDDYRTHGVLAALDAALAITAAPKAHAVGYCLGGTILAATAAAMGRDQDDRLASLTLLAAQTDFSEAGELMMFTDESQIAVLEDLMNAQGYLDARQMSGAFYALRANDLLWSRIARRYFMGISADPGPLDAWFTDATRMPARMHSQYLRWLFLENRLAQGALEIDGRAAALKDIAAPIFALGAERDHIAPWRSVHKIALFAPGPVRFVLSGGGHNSAVVSPPGKAGAYYRAEDIGTCEDYLDPDDWPQRTQRVEGSWQPEWAVWLARLSGSKVKPPPMGAPAYPPLDPAPGPYVLEP